MAVSYDTSGSSQYVVIDMENTGIAATPTLLQDVHADWTIPLRVGSRAGDLLIQQVDRPVVFTWQAGAWRYAIRSTRVLASMICCGSSPAYGLSSSGKLWSLASGTPATPRCRSPYRSPMRSCGEKDQNTVRSRSSMLPHPRVPVRSR